MKTLIIDGPVTDFPLCAPTDAQKQAIKELYLKEFGRTPPVNADYLDIRSAIEDKEPLK